MAKALQSKGGQLFAISTDSSDGVQLASDKGHFVFPLLGDNQAQLISRLGIVHEHGGPGRANVAHPSQFLFDRNGNLVWHYISRRTQVRVPPDELLRRIAEL